MAVNINKIIDRIEEICGMLNNPLANEDKDKLSVELETLLLDVTHYRKSDKRNITGKT